MNDKKRRLGFEPRNKRVAASRLSHLALESIFDGNLRKRLKLSAPLLIGELIQFINILYPKTKTLINIAGSQNDMAP